MLERIERYTEEPLRRRVIDELKPQHKKARVSSKKKDDKKAKEKEKKRKDEAEEPRKKIRHRDTKNKGKPDWAKKKAAKEARSGKKESPAEGSGDK